MYIRFRYLHPWTNGEHVYITVSSHGTCFWDGWPCATKCEINGKAYVERVSGKSKVLKISRNVRISRWPFFALLAAAHSYSLILPRSSRGSSYILALCLHFRFRVSSFLLTLITVFLPFWLRDNETASTATALGMINLPKCNTTFCRQDLFNCIPKRADVCIQATPLIAFLSRVEVGATSHQSRTRSARLVASS